MIMILVYSDELAVLPQTVWSLGQITGTTVYKLHYYGFFSSVSTDGVGPHDRSSNPGWCDCESSALPLSYLTVTKNRSYRIPLNPVKPTSPLGPGDPSLPSSPGRPVVPWSPCSPRGPGNMSGIITSPWIPLGPGTPGSPMDPGKPCKVILQLLQTKIEISTNVKNSDSTHSI